MVKLRVPRAPPQRLDRLCVVLVWLGCQGAWIPGVQLLPLPLPMHPSQLAHRTAIAHLACTPPLRNFHSVTDSPTASDTVYIILHRHQHPIPLPVPRAALPLRGVMCAHTTANPPCLCRHGRACCAETACLTPNWSVHAVVVPTAGVVCSCLLLYIIKVRVYCRAWDGLPRRVIAIART